MPCGQVVSTPPGRAARRSSGRWTKVFIRMKTRLLLALACVAALLLDACETAQPTPVTQAPIFDNLIIPGQRIGPVSIGMTRAELLRVKGEPEETQRLTDAMVYRWSGLRVTVADDNSQVYSVSVDDPAFKTRE